MVLTLWEKPLCVQTYQIQIKVFDTAHDRIALPLILKTFSTFHFPEDLCLRLGWRMFNNSFDVFVRLSFSQFI